ncbi:extracellular solute-binding protein [Paenibacillus filicis]|uniref:Extracellular solute-binding protein n=1 Tax=Paenibacillus gyeongsangnamensis TaxID=3388067 RepID=A0ABT4QG01_9BACL|nr:extracellular solute-binding protein [Paenibacillus filicis]MCZ8515817.1 extracellular solute-binding protein [Paenibacillus filicis]
MATIKDIAKLAGVSHGTASNVLNGKGVVSVEKIQLVEEAARKLGYKMNYKAKSLRSGATNSVSIIIPSIEADEYAQMYKGLDKTLTKLGYQTHLYITYDLPQNEKNILKKIAAERVAGIVTITCLDDANEYYEEIMIPKENIIFVNREIKHAERLVSFDFEQAGSEIAAYLSANHYKSVGIFCDEIKFSNEKHFVDSILNGLKGTAIKLLHAPLNLSYNQSFEFFANESPEIIVTSNLSRAYLLKQAHFFGSTQEIPKILSLGLTQTAYDDNLIIYRQNYHLLGNEIANLLNNQVNHAQEEYKNVIFENNGMTNQITVQPNNKGTITILTISSPTTDALKKLLPHFAKTTGIEATLAIRSYEEIYEILTNSANYKLYDIIRMDMAWLSWFGQDVYRPLSHLDNELDKLIQTLPQHMKHNYSEIEETAYALPFDPSIQMLFYRKDLFEDPKIKRIYYEKYKKQLAIPEDFETYNEVIKFFSKSHFNDSPTSFGTSVTLGKSEIVAAEFLTRYYAEDGKLIHDNGLSLHPKKAKKALKNYLETVSVAQNLNEAWWGEAVNSFARGETAIIIGFMNHVSRIAHSDFGNFIGSASVPGGKPLLGGGVAGISKHSEKIDEAVRFLKWVNNVEIAEQISLLGGTSANRDVCNNQTINTLYPWLSEAYKTNLNGIRDTKFGDGKGFNAKKLEQIIGFSIKNVLDNMMDIDHAIEQINANLATIT